VAPALFHIVARPAWTAACAAGRYEPASLAAEGFVHLSFLDQVAGVADARYADVPDLIVVEFDPARLPMPIRVEDSYGSGTAYPHAYWAIPTAAAVGVHPLTTGPDGRYRFSPGGAAAAASPDR
jgi:uncharacterized protein (DUF952 family)